MSRGMEMVKVCRCRKSMQKQCEAFGGIDTPCTCVPAVAALSRCDLPHA